ncbi:hypothetical protein [Phyllobacterium salinisoli]|uniref:hypothetical protein n=1 Tax=Phyllobacterium salinisoli TaxID=1899321 RepID=UPI0011C04FAB|nr:hypothetical protein [Phyllobacterium salinisoli]
MVFEGLGGVTVPAIFKPFDDLEVLRQKGLRLKKLRRPSVEKWWATSNDWCSMIACITVWLPQWPSIATCISSSSLSSVSATIRPPLAMVFSRCSRIPVLISVYTRRLVVETDGRILKTCLTDFRASAHL